MPRPRLISLIVTTYNRSDALLAVLRGLAAQTDRDFEVIVADDGSRPEHVQRLHAQAGSWPFRCIHTWQADVGFTAAAARNMGVRQASGDYLIFLDGDCVPRPDFVQRHRELARPGCLINGSRVLLDPELSRAAQEPGGDVGSKPWTWWLRQRLRGACNKWVGLFLRWPARWRRARPEFRWKGIRSCNMGVWKHDFEAIDGFDEDFDGWGHEDADFVLRLQRSGCARVDGFWATEVLHLWHPEAARDAQARNLAMVRQRMQDGHEGIRRASHGMSHPRLPELERRVYRLQPGGAPAEPGFGATA